MEHWHVGLVGYFYYQLTGDSGSGAVLGDFGGPCEADTRLDDERKPDVKRAIVVAASIPILLVTAWWTLALVFAGPDPAWLRTGLAAVYALGTLAILLWLRPFAWALAAWGLAFVALLIWWSTIRPSNDGDWQPDVARLAQVEVRGEQLIVHNVRNFDYRTESDFTPRYEDRTYDLSALRGVDVFMSYWGSPAIAHTIMSWQFDNAPPLAISIETRKRKGQEYSAIKGFFKQYEIIYVVADEHDVVGLRTNHRGEEVYLYRLNPTPELARALLLDYVDSINGLVERPQFYNALVDNCTTSIRRHLEHVESGRTSFRLAPLGQRLPGPALVRPKHRRHAPALRRAAQVEPHQRQGEGGGWRSRIFTTDPRRAARPAASWSVTRPRRISKPNLRGVS